MASPTWWTWVWASFRRWWWTGKPGVLQSMGSQSVRHDWATELNWTEVSSEGSIGLIIWDGALTWQMVEANYWPKAQGGLLAWDPICDLSLWFGLIMCSCCPRMSVLKAESGIWPDLGFIQTGTWSLPLYCMGQSDSQESSPIQFTCNNSSVLRLLCSPTLISIHDYWKNHSLTRWNNRLVPNRKRSTSRLYTVTLLI